VIERLSQDNRENEKTQLVVQENKFVEIGQVYTRVVLQCNPTRGRFGAELR
jgi:hypothetical protein